MAVSRHLYVYVLVSKLGKAAGGDRKLYREISHRFKRDLIDLKPEDSAMQADRRRFNVGKREAAKVQTKMTAKLYYYLISILYVVFPDYDYISLSPLSKAFTMHVQLNDVLSSVNGVIDNIGGLHNNDLMHSLKNQIWDSLSRSLNGEKATNKPSPSLNESIDAICSFTPELIGVDNPFWGEKGCMYTLSFFA